MCACLCVCARDCVRVCVRLYVRACVRACVRVGGVSKLAIVPDTFWVRKLPSYMLP